MEKSRSPIKPRHKKEDVRHNTAPTPITRKFHSRGNPYFPIGHLRYSEVSWEELRDVQKIRPSSGAFAALLGSGKAGMKDGGWFR